MFKSIFKRISPVMSVLSLICLFSSTAFAAQTANAVIEIEIEGGGTAVITPEVNCPLPSESSVEVSNGMTEKINITFSETGTYSYTIKALPKEDVYYAPDFYTALVTVSQDSSGALNAVTVLSRNSGGSKPDVCRFTESSTPVQGQGETVPATEAPKNPPTSRPKTGDDSMLDIYLIIGIAAAAGLFALSVAYAASTNKLIKK